MNATKFARECGLIGEPHRCDYTCDCDGPVYEIATRHVAPREPIELPCGDPDPNAAGIIVLSALCMGVLFALAIVSKLVTGEWF